MSDELPRHVLKWPEQGVEMAFRLIPAGCFRMGRRGREASEQPVHHVRITHPFWLAETQVTHPQFAIWNSLQTTSEEADSNDKHTGIQTPVSWRTSVAYCRWLARVKEDSLPAGFSLASLPTEAEWEYSLSAFDAEDDCRTWSKIPKLGMLWEWCYDAWEVDYRRRVEGAPDPTARERIDSCKDGMKIMSDSNHRRLLRGGFTGRYGFSYRRMGRHPEAQVAMAGFRVCLISNSGYLDLASLRWPAAE